MLRIILCENDRKFCSNMEEIIQKLGKLHLIYIDIEVYFSGEKLYKRIFNKELPIADLIIINVMLDDLNGIEIGKKIRDSETDYFNRLLYISNNEKFAMDLFDIQPFNLLIKPIIFEKFEQVFLAFIKRYYRANSRFSFISNRVEQNVHINEIKYFESVKEKISIYLSNDRKFEFYGKLDNVEESIKANKFIRIHKSLLVNYDFVKERTYNEITLFCGTKLSISKSNRSKIHNMIINNNNNNLYKI